MNKIILSLSNKIIKCFFILFVICFSASSIFTTYYLDYFESSKYHIVYENGATIINILLFVFLLIIIYFLNIKKFFGIKKHVFLFIELFVFLLEGIILIILNNSCRLESDSMEVFNLASSLYSGDLSVIGFGSYINAYPNNCGLLAFESLLFFIFKEPNAVIFAFRIINLLCSMMIYYYLYRITELLFNDYQITMNLLCLCLGFTQLLFSSLFVYGNVISYSFAIISIFYLLKFFKTNKIIDALLMVICISYSVFMRTNTLIIFIAELIFYCLYLIKTKKIIILPIILLSLITIYFSTIGIKHYYENLSNCNYDESKYPTIVWLAYGLNYDSTTPGRFFNELETIYKENNFDTSELINVAKYDIDQALLYLTKNSMRGLRFINEKFGSSWCDPRYDSFTKIHNTINPVMEIRSFQKLFTYYWDSFLSVLSIGLFIFIIKIKHFGNEYLLLGLCVIGGFIFHFAWEVKALYCLQYVLLLLPYGAYGLSNLTRFSKQ